MQAADLPEKFVAIISAVLVVQPSVGGTAAKAWDRVVATIVGSVVGIACLSILPTGFGTAVALAIAMFVMNAIAAYKLDWRYGVVAAIALSLGAVDNTLQTAIDRGIAIGLGVVGGLASSFILWPESAKNWLRRHARSAINDSHAKFKAAADKILSGEGDSTEEFASKFHEHLDDAYEVLPSVAKTQKQGFADYLDAIEVLYHSILIIDRVAFSSDRPDGGSIVLNQSLKKLFSDIESAIKAFAATDQDGRNAIGQLPDDRQDFLGKLDENESALERYYSGALGFGLSEVVRSLCDLEEKLKEIDDTTGSVPFLDMAQEAAPRT